MGILHFGAYRDPSPHHGPTPGLTRTFPSGPSPEGPALSSFAGQRSEGPHHAGALFGWAALKPSKPRGFHPLPRLQVGDPVSVDPGVLAGWKTFQEGSQTTLPIAGYVGSRLKASWLPLWYTVARKLVGSQRTRRLEPAGLLLFRRMA